MFGFEEAHGYLAGTYTRDKDGAVAAMLLAELAAECKSKEQSLHEQLDRLFVEYGCHMERTISHTMPGADGDVHLRVAFERRTRSQRLGQLVEPQRQPAVVGHRFPRVRPGRLVRCASTGALQRTSRRLPHQSTEGGPPIERPVG